MIVKYECDCVALIIDQDGKELHYWISNCDSRGDREPHLFEGHRDGKKTYEPLPWHKAYALLNELSSLVQGGWELKEIKTILKS